MKRPGWTEFVPLYVAFDLSQLTLWRLVSVGLFPLVLFALVAPFAFALTGIEEQLASRSLVICEDCAPGLLENTVSWAVEVAPEAPVDLPERLRRGEIDAVAVLDLEGSPVVQPWGDGSWSSGKLDRRLRRWVERRWVEERAGPVDLVIERPDGKVIDDGARDHFVPTELVDADHAPDPKAIQEAVSRRFQVRDLGSGVGYAAIGLMGLLIGLPLGAGIAEKGREGFLALIALQASRTAIYVGEMISDGLQVAMQSAVWWLLYLGIGAVSLAAGLVAGELGVEVFGDMAVVVGLAAFSMIQSCGIGVAYGQLVQDVPVQVREHGRTILLLAIFGGAQALTPLFEQLVLTSERVAWVGALPGVGPLALWKLHLDGAWQLWPLVGLHVGWAAVAVVVGSWFFHLQDSPMEWVRRTMWGDASSR